MKEAEKNEPAALTRRVRALPDEDIRKPYVRDATRILHSPPFRRLRHKTQVFFSPQNDHICTRLEHALHVASIATLICRDLKEKKPEEFGDLDEQLAYAIALGHDLGHAPFGHFGETVLHEMKKRIRKIDAEDDTFTMAKYKGFAHEIQSLRVVDSLTSSREGDGVGLALTYAVRDGIASHCGETAEEMYLDVPNATSQKRRAKKALEKLLCRDRVKKKPITAEGCIVRFSDKIAYLGRDIEDALVARIVHETDVPEDIREFCNIGKKQWRLRKKEWINSSIIKKLVLDLISNTGDGKISLSKAALDFYATVYCWNKKNIYKSPKLQPFKQYAELVLTTLFMELDRAILEAVPNCFETTFKQSRATTLSVFYDCIVEFRYSLLHEYGDPVWKEPKNHAAVSQRARKTETSAAIQKLQSDPTKRVQFIIDYLAGMTDSFAMQSHRELLDII